MKTAILLVMHGVPPGDFPRDEMNEFFGLPGRLRRADPSKKETLQKRYNELEKKMREWPRTRQNDPFYFASQELAAGLKAESGLEVEVGFNEFCAPDIDAAFDNLAGAGAEKIIVATTMMTRGGEHSETEIRNAIEEAMRRHPGTSIVYAWPYETKEVARFLTGHIGKFL